MGEQQPASEGNSEIWRKLWTLQEQLIALQKDQATHQQTVSKQLGEIKEILSQAKGGWHMLLVIGGGMAAIATIIVEFFRKP